ncbi:hypothetical protein [uncultured Sphingomonas sp.]|uniref:hypothetical protein n=1 Tax=uncultured Sphingomonas sp. TaxID=158754 RepID=UPI0035CAC03A
MPISPSRLLLPGLALLALAGCSRGAAPANNESAMTRNDAITDLDENAVDAGLANIVDVGPSEGDGSEGSGDEPPARPAPRPTSPGAPKR